MVGINSEILAVVGTLLDLPPCPTLQFALASEPLQCCSLCLEFPLLYCLPFTLHLCEVADFWQASPALCQS